MTQSSPLSPPDNQPLVQISNLLNLSKTALGSISKKCLELDMLTQVLEQLTLMLEANEQAQLYPIISLLSAQAADLEESKVALNETLHKAAQAYIEINVSRRNALARFDPSAGVSL